MVQITKVNLPERTRARFETESNQQRVLKPHDIRGAIPLVDYTNPAKFPPHAFREYPKMPLLAGNQPIIIDESGGVLVFYDAADETEFKGLNPELADEIEANAPTKALADLVASKDAELETLRARLRAAGLEDKKKPTNALAAAVRPPANKPRPAHGKASEPAPDGMAARVKQAEADQAGADQEGGKANPLKKRH